MIKELIDGGYLYPKTPGDGGYLNEEIIIALAFRAIIENPILTEDELYMLLWDECGNNQSLCIALTAMWEDSTEWDELVKNAGTV